LIHSIPEDALKSGKDNRLLLELFDAFSYVSSLEIRKGTSIVGQA